MSTTFDLTNGDRATVIPFSPPRLRDALIGLKKKGYAWVVDAPVDLLTAIEFSIESCRVVLKEYEQKNGDSFKKLNDRERNTLIIEFPDLVKEINDKASELQNEDAKAKEADAKN